MLLLVALCVVELSRSLTPEPPPRQPQSAAPVDRLPDKRDRRPPLGPGLPERPVPRPLHRRISPLRRSRTLYYFVEHCPGSPSARPAGVRLREGTSLATRRLNQDGLENFFGMVRQANGGNYKPDCFKFRCAFRKAAVTNVMAPSEHGNCEPERCWCP